MKCEKCNFEFRPNENFCARCYYSRQADECNLEKWQLIEIIAKTYSNVSFAYYRKLGGGSVKPNLNITEIIEIKIELENVMKLTNWAVRK